MALDSLGNEIVVNLLFEIKRMESRIITVESEI